MQGNSAFIVDHVELCSSKSKSLNELDIISHIARSQIRRALNSCYTAANIYIRWKIFLLVVTQSTFRHKSDKIVGPKRQIAKQTTGYLWSNTRKLNDDFFDTNIYMYVYDSHK